MKGGPIAALLLTAGLVPATATAGSTALPQIAATPVDGGIRLEASVLGLDAGQVTATFTVEREENGNLLRTSQSTTLTLGPNETGAVAQTTFSMDQDARLTATLLLQSDGTHVGDTTLRIGPEGH